MLLKAESWTAFFGSPVNNFSRKLFISAGVYNVQIDSNRYNYIQNIKL